MPASLPVAALANGMVEDGRIAFLTTARRISLKIFFPPILALHFPERAHSEPAVKNPPVTLDIGAASTDAPLS